MNRLPTFLVILLVASAGCQPLCGLVFSVVLPEGADTPSGLQVEAMATDDDGNEVEPSRVHVAHTDRGFVVEVSYFEPGAHIAPRVWIDVDGNGERGPGDLEAQVPRTRLDGAGCDSMTTLDTPVLLAPIPDAT